MSCADLFWSDELFCKITEAPCRTRVTRENGRSTAGTLIFGVNLEEEEEGGVKFQAAEITVERKSRLKYL